MGRSGRRGGFPIVGLDRSCAGTVYSEGSIVWLLGLGSAYIKEGDIIWFRNV